MPTYEHSDAHNTAYSFFLITVMEKDFTDSRIPMTWAHLFAKSIACCTEKLIDLDINIL
jgi:hypothetical protein